MARELEVIWVKGVHLPIVRVVAHLIDLLVITIIVRLCHRRYNLLSEG